MKIYICTMSRISCQFLPGIFHINKCATKSYIQATKYKKELNWIENVQPTTSYMPLKKIEEAKTSTINT
jgi:hypothetical protein